MKNQLKIFGITVVLLLCISVFRINAENCISSWVSPDPDQVHNSVMTWQQSLPVGCSGGCAKIRVTLQVINYNDAGALDLYSSNTDEIDYGDPTGVFNAPKLGWIGRIKVPITVASPGWKTVSFDFRLPHLEWVNDNRTIFLSLEGPLYMVHGAQFRVASSSIETIEWNADIDGDGDIDGSDLAGLAVNYGCTGNCNADFDGNGVVDENDLVAFGDEFAWSGCPLGFYESFNDGSANNWIRTPAWGVADNAFEMNGSQPPQSLIQYAYYNDTYDNFSFEASVKQTQGEQGYASGLYFRSSSGLTSGYQFLVAAVGAYEIAKVVSGNFTTLVPWTSTSGIAFYTGYNAWNRLRVNCSGSTLQFYINGHLVETLSDSSYQSGVAGVLAVDSSTILNIFNFDDVLLEESRIP